MIFLTLHDFGLYNVAPFSDQFGTTSAASRPSDYHRAITDQKFMAKFLL
ncbi:hypothetical protein N9Q38_02495 [Pseudomonadales bacterium]|nr:hypothetical protein [Pseudomonadales bacterium]MDB9868236.1 hypothetical protein [Pseudomonadales bacterium]MDB9942355.1 hypothetical protein [Pseudomonadales bacterium]